MPNAIPHKFKCECGQVLINHYKSQILNHRLSKKHAVRLINRIKSIEQNDIFNSMFLPIISIYKLIKGFLKVFLCEFQKKNN